MFTGAVRRTYFIEPMRDPVHGGTPVAKPTDPWCGDAIGRIPDYFEPVVGWRTWRVVDSAEGMRLRSVVFETDWIPGAEMRARCELVMRRTLSRPWRSRPVHQAPYTDCECGIWAAKEIDYAGGFFDLYGKMLSDTSVHRVIGRVALWGSVVDGGLGWRASRAYPTHIYVPRWREDGRQVDVGAIARRLGDYGVPVEIVAEVVRAEFDHTQQEICPKARQSVTEPPVQ